VDVAVVGGGPAGAATAIGLAMRGVQVALFERSPTIHWRASGVYSSPLTRARLAELGLDEAQVSALVRRVPALTVQVGGGPSCRLEYGAEGGASGVDRVRLDEYLLDRAAACGADVRTGTAVLSIEPREAAPARLTVAGEGGSETFRASVVVGADGPGSLVARAFGAQRHTRWLRRAGITFHVGIPPETPSDGRMVIGHGWYCGLCPVPGDRLNVGIVIGERQLRRALHRGERPADVARRILAALPGDEASLADAPVADAVTVALPLANRVSRRAGPGFALVGDAAGFIDPISGDGLHRALVTAALATEAIRNQLSRPGTPGLADYDRALRARFRDKDAISWLIQAFMARPEVLGYAVKRLGSRDRLRETFASVMGDLVPAHEALAPRRRVALLRP
jgi:menaquinone-9 beta-reductase